MDKKNAVPEVRFKGFEGEWEERALGEVADIIGGGTPSTNNPDYWNGDIDWYSPTEIGDFIYTDGSLKKITALGLGKSSAKLLPANKTILFTSRAGIGDMAILRNVGSTNQGFQSLVLKDDIDTYFIYSKGYSIKKYAEKNASGSTFLEIYGKRLANMSILLPCKKEQTRIGELFRNIDARITLEQRKYEKLQTIKKSMLEKMFPQRGATVPEVRFRGFSGEWEEKKFSNTFENISNNTLSRACLNYKGGLARNIHYGDILINYAELLDIKKSEIPYITDDKQATKFISSILKNGDIIIADTAEDKIVGKCTEIINIDEEIIVAGLHTIPCRTKQNFSVGYLGYFMNSQSYHMQLIQLMQGTKVTSISKTALKDTFILYPNDKYNEEQARIGKLFRNLDTFITLQQRKCEKLQNIKKAMLGKIFV